MTSNIEYKKEIEYKIQQNGNKLQLCKILDCSNCVRKKGICGTHYKIVMGLCTSKCKEKALDDGSGKCMKHHGNINLEIKKTLNYKILPSGYKQRLCTVENCNKSARKGGMCRKHTNIKMCIYPQCNQLSCNCKELCDEHFKDYSACNTCKNILKLDMFYIMSRKELDNDGKIITIKYPKADCILCYSKNRIPESKKYYENHKEGISVKAKIYREKNRDQIRSQRFEYYEKNPFKILVRSCSYYDKINGRNCDITEEYIKKLLAKQDYKCYYCNQDLEIINRKHKFSQISVDRIDSDIGHIKGNCVASCLFCNRCKNETKLHYFIDFINVLKDKSLIENIKSKYDHIKKHPKLINNMMSSAYHYDIKKSDDVNIITVKEIKDLLIKQNNCCAITGIPLINAHILKFPFKMSLDRIDNTKLHTKDNCQLVCLAIQYGRNDKSIDEVKEYINEIMCEYNNIINN